MKLPDESITSNKNDTRIFLIFMIVDIFFRMYFDDLEDPEEGVARREGHGGGGETSLYNQLNGPTAKLAKDGIPSRIK